MEKCSVTTCEKQGTQLFNVPPPVEGSPFVCSSNTLFFNDEDGELTFYSPAPSPVPLCPKHYDETVAYYRQMSESDDPNNEEFRELVKLNN